MKIRAHLLGALGEEQSAWLRAELSEDIDLTVGTSPPAPPDIQVLISGRPEEAVLDGSPSLESLVIPFAGLPDVTRERLLDRPHLRVYNLHHNAVITAELALSLLLAAAKCLLPLDRSLRKRDWRPRYRPSPSLLLEGKTALVLGYGRIGASIAGFCRALSMQVIATRRSQDRPDRQDDVTLYPASYLHDLLPRSNTVIVTLPLTDETRGLLGARELALLPEGSVLVNVGRGPIVEQQALYDALRQGPLFAAGLDVWYNYPREENDRPDTPPADLPFHELDNVVMSPHRGGHSRETEKRRMRALARLLNAFPNGDPETNRVDVARGY